MDPTGDGRTPAQEPADRTRTLLYALVAVLAVAVVALTAVLALRDDAGQVPGSQASPTPTSATTTSPAPTSESPSTPPTTPTAISAAEAGTVVWPAPGGTVYDDPAEAARGMATGLAGFTDPVVGAFRQGDARSGEVDIRPKATGPATTVLVRQLSDGHWYAIGASSDDLRLTTPDVGAAVSSPVTVRGRSRAFEGTIIVTVLAQGDPAPLGRQPLIGGGAELGPFSGTVSFQAPAGQVTGAIMLTTDSAEDGRIWQATVVPVAFAS